VNNGLKNTILSPGLKINCMIF